MLPIPQITDPGLQCRCIMLRHQTTVCFDSCSPRDRRPLARGIDEGNVDMGVGSEVVRLARLGISVEEKVDTVGLLLQVRHSLIVVAMIVR